jgi:hypothetical protein
MPFFLNLHDSMTHTWKMKIDTYQEIFMGNRKNITRALHHLISLVQRHGFSLGF